MKNITRFKILILVLNLMQVGSIHLRLMFNEMIWVHDELKHGKLTGASGSRQIVKTWFTSTTVTPFYPGFTAALATIWLTNWTVGSQGMTITIYIGGEIKNKNFNKQLMLSEFNFQFSGNHDNIFQNHTRTNELRVKCIDWLHQKSFSGNREEEDWQTWFYAVFKITPWFSLSCHWRGHPVKILVIIILLSLI